MQNSEDIPQGLSLNSHKSSQQRVNKSQSLTGQNKQINQTDPLDQLIGKNTQEHRTSVEFRKRSSRTQIGQRYKTKAVSQNYQFSQKRDKILEELEEKDQQLIEVLPKKRSQKKTKKYKEPIKLPPANSQIKINTQPAELEKVNLKPNQFNRRDYYKQKILKDIDKNPIKYKIMCEVFGCKPDIAYEMHKDETSHVQQEYTKQKGLQYLRQGNAKAKYSYLRDHRSHSNFRRQRVKTQIMPRPNKQQEEPQIQSKNKIKISKSQKILKLSNKEAVEGKKVYDRVKKHISNNQYNDNYFKHLSSEESIDHALVSFLKTKIKKAQVVLK